jgi:hypothetical protein
LSLHAEARRQNTSGLFAARQWPWREIVGMPGVAEKMLALICVEENHEYR